MISLGKHKARAIEAALGLTSTGKEQVAVAFEIIDGPHTGETINYYGYFTEKTAKRTMESLRILGWSSDDLTDLSDVTGECTLVVEHEPDQNGDMRARVRWVNPPGGGLDLKEKLEGGAAKAFAARMRGLAAASRSGAKPVARPATNGVKPSVKQQAADFDADEPIPF